MRIARIFIVFVKGEEKYHAGEEREKKTRLIYGREREGANNPLLISLRVFLSGRQIVALKRMSLIYPRRYFIIPTQDISYLTFARAFAILEFSLPFRGAGTFIRCQIKFTELSVT